MTQSSRLLTLLHGVFRLPEHLGWPAALVCATVLAVLMLADAPMAQQRPDEPRLPPITNTDAPNAIPGQYIVVFRPGTARNVVEAGQERIRSLGGRILSTYTTSIIGFSVRLPVEGPQAQRALQALRELPGVAYIEADQTVSLQTIQNNPPAGLDRIDRRLLPPNSTFTYTQTGQNVHAYVVDTGIFIAHTDFEGRATSDFSVTSDLSDCFGHGTHVAGIIGGKTFGVAKKVALHSVRVFSTCGPNTSLSSVITGVDWVTNNHNTPAVANMSLRVPFVSASLETAVSTSIAAGVTYVVAAGNDYSTDACTVSPAHLPQAITVGATDPVNDTRANFSNIGTCLDLFAPGVGIVSAMPDTVATMSGCTPISNTPGSRSQRCGGTSMAAPHVAGAAAQYLQNHAAATPADVWNAIHAAANVSTTPGWGGVINAGTGSPNELLHWGSLSDGKTDGDPHLTTVDNIHYDFQSAGEFVLLRDGSSMEIQTRQAAVSTQSPIANPYTGLATCVSLNTAVAARVGQRRVTYQPVPSTAAALLATSGMQLRVDGVPTTLGTQGITLGPGARVMRSPVGNGIEIDFPDGTNLSALPNFWGPPHNRWYLNVRVFGTPASEGIIGSLAPGSWLPALSDGASLGPRPAALHQRYVDLYQTFAGAWRVTNATSLFDYAPGTSTATFTVAGWPPENPPCNAPEGPSATPISQQAAQQICSAIVDRNDKANCVFDVAITGEPGFARLYLLSQRLEAGATRTTINEPSEGTFVASVVRRASSRGGIPIGMVQFTIDGANAGQPVRLNERGQATLRISPQLRPGCHQVMARYVPARNGRFLASTSFATVHDVGGTSRCRVD